MRNLVRLAVLSVVAGLCLLAQGPTILVAYHSESGHTKVMAEALADGARGVEGTRVVLKPLAEVTKDDLAAADGIAVGSPVHMGDVAWPVRQTMVRWAMEFGFWESRALENKVLAVFATGGLPSNGKEFTMLSLAQSLVQMGMVLVTPYGSMGASATTSKPDPGVDEAEKGIASGLGKRLATVAARMRVR